MDLRQVRVVERLIRNVRRCLGRYISAGTGGRSKTLPRMPSNTAAGQQLKVPDDPPAQTIPHILRKTGPSRRSEGHVLRKKDGMGPVIPDYVSRRMGWLP